MPPYNSNIFVIEQKKTKVVIEQKKTLFGREKQVDYYVYNVGNTNVEASVVQGGSFISLDITKAMLKPGEEATLKLGDKAVVSTALKIKNLGDIKAMVHASKVTGYNEFDNKEHAVPLNSETIAKALIDFGPTKMPEIGKDFKPILEYFWPTEHSNVWETFSKEVLNLVGEKTETSINDVITKNLNEMKERLHAVNQLLSKDPKPPSLGQQYLGLAEDLIGFEHKFTVTKANNPDYINVNFLLLPLYSATVDLKVAHLQFGILNENVIGIEDNGIDRLQKYGQKLLKDAINHVNTTRDEKIKELYNTVYDEAIFEEFSTARNYIVLGGVEHIAYWESAIKDPENFNKPYNTAITYSNYYGRPTPKLLRQMITENVPEPLKPLIKDGKIVKPKEVLVSLLTLIDSNEEKIAGLTVVYEDGHSVLTGQETKKQHSVIFTNKNLLTLTAWGNGKIDGITFNFDDGSVDEIGSQDGEHHDFQLENHQIVGFYMANDYGPLKGQAANMAVSYQVIPAFVEDTNVNIVAEDVDFDEDDINI